MWKFDNGSYYRFDGDDLLGSIIHIGPEDGVNPNTYSVQIQTADGGLVSIGLIPQNMFNAYYARLICDYAITENKDYDWWIANGFVWWKENSFYD